ncbi:MAG: hypothetical protein R3C60_02115 [Parvularculaceae bacterium]
MKAQLPPRAPHGAGLATRRTKPLKISATALALTDFLGYLHDEAEACVVQAIIRDGEEAASARR